MRNRPLQTIVIFSEILSRSSLANARTKALIDEITKISLLTLSVSSIDFFFLKLEKIVRKSIMAWKAFRPESTAFDPDHLTAVTRHGIN